MPTPSLFSYSDSGFAADHSAPRLSLLENRGDDNKFHKAIRIHAEVTQKGS